MSFEEIQNQLTALQESLEELRGLIVRLGTGAVTTDLDDADGDDADAADDAAADLAAEIADGLRDAQDELELLQEDLADLPATTAMAAAVTATAAATTNTATGDTSRHDRARLQEGLARLLRETQTHHAAFRQARLAARQALDQIRRRDQVALLEAYAWGEEEEEEDGDEDDDDDEQGQGIDGHDRTRHIHRRPPPARKPLSAAASAAADVTAALRQTHARIAGEVARSEFAAQTLAESSRALEDLGDRYGGGGGTSKTTGSGGGDIASSLQSARHLVRGLVAAHKSDTWYLQTALYLVAATVAWLLFRRLLYGPLWLLVWWPLRTVWGVTGTAVGLVGSGSGSGSSVSSIATAVTSPLAATPSSVSVSVSVSASAAAAAGTAAAPSSDSDSLVDAVGQVIDDTAAQQQEAATEHGDASADAPRNPMKRMWEEDVEAAKHAAQQAEEAQAKSKEPKDEL